MSPEALQLGACCQLPFYGIHDRRGQKLVGNEVESPWQFGEGTHVGSVLDGHFSGQHAGLSEWNETMYNN